MTVMVSPQLADGCEVTKDAAAALIATGWRAPDADYSASMDHLIDSARAALKDKNWYAALTLALTFPDICASLESRSGKSNKALYSAWVEQYLTPKYTIHVGATERKHVFLSGGDCYALRCAYLHQGITDTTGHSAREALSSFEFSAPRVGSYIHCNQADDRLQLQVDVFTEDMCKAVELWMIAATASPIVTERMGELMLITETASAKTLHM
ncbi:hypothetical protein ACFQ9D_12060 [Arthrobacter koreensis]|uniref:hypothetical protein n=1 Tax=Arthrobacter koreensis TaxID=199136 RepID=UPI00363E08DB